MNEEELDDLKYIQTQIEPEEGNEDIANEIPFDPNDINVNIVPRTIGQLVDMLEYNEIVVPKYQRLPDLWSIKKKSRFIESLMLNLPIPLFYFDESADKKWLVIDGLQRISTLEHFILGNKKRGNGISNYKEPFKLQNLEFKTDYNNKTWKELPKDIQRRISTNQVTINLIGKGTPEQVKYNIFSRINQGATVLKPQEIRTALFHGRKMGFIKSLVSKDTGQGKIFIKATQGSIPSKRQEDLDFATRFVTFYLLDYKAYEPDMDSYMTKGTDKIPESDTELQKIISSFKNSMNLANEIFGKHAFRKRKNLSNDARERINKPMFEVISTSFARLTEKEQIKLMNNKNSFIKEFTMLQNNDEFWTAITTGTATKDSVTNRHKEFINVLTQFI